MSSRVLRKPRPGWLVRMAQLINLVDAPDYGGDHDQETQRGHGDARGAAAHEDLGIGVSGPRLRAPGQRQHADGKQGGEPRARDEAEDDDLPDRCQVDPVGHSLLLPPLRPLPRARARPEPPCRPIPGSRWCDRSWSYGTSSRSGPPPRPAG